jgi:Zn-finger nucleic acid-binding protein
MSDDTDTSANPRTLNCPKCKATMETISFQDIKVDRCTSCKGLWFDALERDHLDALRGAESIDIGEKPSSPLPALMDCPACHTRMIDMVDIGNPQLRYKSCMVCYGLFFDAGEYRDHKEHSTLSFFHQLFHRG